MTRLSVVLVALLVAGSAVGGPVAGWTGSVSSESPAVDVAVAGSPVEEGDRVRTHEDDQITVDAAVGAAASADVTLSEVVVRVNGDLVESRSVDGETATESIRPDYDQGNNSVRVIVTDSEGNVDATRFTVYHDSSAPRIGLDQPFDTAAWSGIDDGNVTGTNQTFAGHFFDDSAVDRIVLAHSYGEQGDTVVVDDVDENFSFTRELGYTGADNRTNRFRMDVVDEFGNSRAYYFSIDATDGEDPSISTGPVPNETTQNVVDVSGIVSDDVWVRSANVTVDPQVRNLSADTDAIREPREYEYHSSGDGRTLAFNETVHVPYPGTYDVTITATDAAGNAVNESFSIERVRRQTDVRPTIELDADRTVVTGNESLFLAGSSFEGVTSRLVVETRTPDGDTVDYQVVHSDSDEERVDFGRQVGIADGRTKVVVRAFDPDDNEVTERFFVDGSTRETFLEREDLGGDSDGDTGDEGEDGDDVDWPLVSVTPLQDERRGTASSSVTVRRVPPGTVGVPAADGPDDVATTGNVTLEGMDLSVVAETNLTGTVVVRDRGAGDLRGPADARPAATVSIQHSVPADRVDGLTLDLAVERSYLDDRGIDPANLTVYRSSDGWTELNTTLVEDGDERVRYRVESPGLSVFSLATSGQFPTNGTSDGNETVGNGTAGNETMGNETVGNETAGNETANGTDAGDTGEAQIFVTNVTVNRTQVAVNESVTVDATLANSGDASGTYVATLESIQGLNRTAVDQQLVEVAPGEQRTIQFRTAFAEPGNHTVAVNGTQAGPVVVEEGSGLLSVFAFVPLRLIGLVLGAIVGLLVVLTLVRFVLRRVGSGGEASG